jgi:thiamine-phosphate pyrophosphorylase
MDQVSNRFFQFIGITDDNVLSQDKELLENLLAGGLDYLYWRNSLEEELLPPVAPTYQDRCLVAAPSAKLVRTPFRWHLKESDRQRLVTAGDLTHEKPFSTSIHQLSEWPKLAGQVEMVFYSPLFESISKPGYGPTVRLDILTEQIGAMREQQSTLPLLIGLGGITADTVAQVRQAGFDGAALMGALWQMPDPVAALQEIRMSAFF